MNWLENPNCPKVGDRLCSIADVPDGGGFEVSFGEGETALRLLLLRKGERCWGYVNNCPHFSLPLNFEPQNFVIFEDMVVCAHHTAFFNFDDGACVDGPCAGTGLTNVPIYQRGYEIYFGHHN